MVLKTIKTIVINNKSAILSSRRGMTMILWFLDAVCLIMTILFLLGKGAFFIAGYNTLSKEQKARYNEKRLCRLFGAVMLSVTLVLFVFALYDGDAPNSLSWLMPWGIIIPVVVALILANTKYVVDKSITLTRSKTALYRNIVIVCLIGVVVTFLLFMGSVDIALEKEYMNVDATFVSEQEIAYEDISDVQYVEDYDVGSRTNGIGSFTLEAGRFKNDDLGRYRLYSYTSCEDYIILTTTNEMVVVNQKSKEETKQLYQEIKENSN
jgi:hypothetical protein